MNRASALDNRNGLSNYGAKGRRLEAATWFSGLFCFALALSLVADPVFRSFGFFEIALAGSLAGCVVVPAIAIFRKMNLSHISAVDVLIVAFLLSLLISAVIGLSSAPPIAVLRSGAPYALFVVALLVSVSNIRVRWRWVLGTIFVIAIGQGLYHAVLFLQNNDDFESNLSVLIGRITLLDPRTTVPFFLLLPSLSFVALLSAKRPFWRAVAVVTLALGVVCSFLTLTRTHVLVALGALVLAVGVASIRAARGKRSDGGRWLTSTAATVGGVGVAAGLLVTVPQLRALPELFFLRTAIEVDATALSKISTSIADQLSESRQNSGAETGPLVLSDSEMGPEVSRLTKDAPALLHLAHRFLSIGVPQTKAPNLDELEGLVRDAIESNGVNQTRLLLVALANEVYKKAPDAGFRDAVEVVIIRTVTEMTTGPQKPGGGRISDEWLPAYTQFRSAPFVKQLFGIGCGVPFVTSGGEPRTYIHNFPLYVLVYQGWFGLLVVCALLGGVVFRLVVGYLQTGDPVLLSAISILAVVQGAGLLFAIHKLISGNLLMVTVLLAASTSSALLQNSRGKA